MTAKPDVHNAVHAENAMLHARLDEAEETLRAIRSGHVDALLVDGSTGPQVFTLQGIDAEASRFRGEILSQVSDAVMAICEDRITYLNSAAERQYGFTASEVLGRPLTQIYRTRWDQPDDEAAAISAIIQLGKWTGENIHVTRDGRELRVESSITTLRGRNGEAIGQLAVIRDITCRRQAEDALQVSNERFRVMADAIDQLAWIALPDGKVVWYNQRWYEYTGTDLTQMQGWGWKSVHDPAVLPRFIERWNASLQSGEPFEMTFPLRAANGDFHQFLTRGVPLKNQEGQVVQWFVTSTDVDVIARAEATMREYNERMVLATEATGVGIWEWNLFTDEVRWDAQMFRIYGIEPTATGLIPFSRWRDAIHPDDRPRQEILRSILQRSGNRSREFRIRRHDTGDFRHIQSVEMTRTDERGQIEWVVGTNLDITERLRSETAKAAERIVFERIATGAGLSEILDTLLRQTEAQSNDDMRLSIMLLDKSGKHLRFGAAPSLPANYTKELQSVPVGPSIGSCGPAAFTGEPVFVDDIATDPQWAGFKDLAMAHGIRACCSIPVISLEGRTLGTAAAYYDRPLVLSEHDRHLIERTARLAAIIIDRKQAEESLAEYTAELERADRNKDEFLAMLAHELRNPLAPLRNAVEILRSPKVDSKSRTHAQTAIERQIENLGHMIDDLLDVSRITEGKIVLRKQQVVLQSVLQSAVQSACGSCVADGQKLSLSIPPAPIHLHGDATRLEQIFGNILGNAVKYSGSGSRISLAVSLLEIDEVEIRISDDGIGIDPELLPHIFDLFVQSSRTLDRAHGGLGIGLTIVHRLVKLHDGTIEARSEGIGHGVEFIIRLPMLPSPAAVPPPVTKANSTEAPLRILIVDDNEDAAETMAMLQQLRGHQTHTAHTGPDAVAAARDFLPQVVLLDIGLPGMDGFEVARRIRTIPDLKHALLLALSGYGSAGDRERARAAGFDEHLAKPADLKRLHELLRDFSKNQQT